MGGFEDIEMKFRDFICFDAIIPELESNNRNGVISELISALDKAGRLGKGNLSRIKKAVIKRENEASTGIGKAVAVPHVKHPAVSEVIGTVGQSSKGIDFSALDKQPVHSIILLISPVDKPEKHLKAMESIFRHLQKDRFRSFLRQSKTAEDIEDLLTEADENPSL